MPSTGLLDRFLKDGDRKFVFEGRECGGHVDPRSSFALWDAQIESLLTVDDPDASAASAPGERIDYLWLATPPGMTVAVDRPRRWAFSGRGVVGGPAGSLSDHLALSVTLRLAT